MRFRALLIFLLATVSIIAQDLHFSQAFEHPSLVNPALTGATARMRASVASKDQWRSATTPYRTIGASIEMGRSARGKVTHAGKFGSAVTHNSSRIAAGFSVYRDRAGDGLLSLTLANLSIAAFVPTGKRSRLSLGMQGSYAQRSLDQSGLVFPSQYSGTGYDNSISSGEELVTDRYHYFDCSGGLLWSYGQDEKTFVTHKEIKAHVGVAAYHLLEPGRQFVPRRFDPLQRRYVAHADALMSFSTRTALAPAVLYQLQGSSSELLAGATFRYYLQNVTKYTGFVNRTVIGGGLFVRNGDALIISGLFEWDERYVVGISYDVNYSHFATASRRRGGLEFTLRYSLPGGFLYEKR